MRKQKDKLILVVEDDDTLRLLISKQLQRLGFAAQLAANGTEAISLFSTGSYSMILMDIQMPKVDGFEATSAIREIETKEKRHRIPIVAVTANPDKKSCFERGMDDFIFKPVMLPELEVLLRRWLPGANNFQNPAKSTSKSAT